MHGNYNFEKSLAAIGQSWGLFPPPIWTNVPWRLCFWYCHYFVLIHSELQKSANTQFVTEPLIHWCGPEFYRSVFCRWSGFREVWWVKLSWEELLHFQVSQKKNNEKEKKKRKEKPLQVSLQHPRLLGVGFDGSQLQGTEWSARAMRLLLLKVAVLPRGGRWGDISAASATTVLLL